MDQDNETPPNKMDRNHDGRFKKGQSGNPGGGPKIFTEVKQAAREHKQGITDQSPQFSRTRRCRGLAGSPNRCAAG